MKKVYEKIEEAKTKLGLSSHALSKRIGHNASYLSQIRVISTEKQERLIRELNAAIDGEKVKTDSQIIDELKDDAINLNVVISDLESYKKQAAFDLTEAHSNINNLKEHLESYRKENSNLVNELDDRKETQGELVRQLRIKDEVLNGYYSDLDNLELALEEVCNQRDQLLDANKSLEDYYDVLACKNNRFGAYIFLLIVTLSIMAIAFLIYVQSH